MRPMNCRLSVLYNHSSSWSQGKHYSYGSIKLVYPFEKRNEKDVTSKHIIIDLDAGKV